MSEQRVAVAGSGTLRVLGAQPEDLAKLAGFLDLSAGPSGVGEPPLLTLRFVDSLDRSGWRLVGGDHATDGEHLFMRSGAGWARLPLGDTNAVSELLCERSAVEVPHLVDLLNLAALHRGSLPLHAAALSRQDRGLLLIGWSRGGKTEAVLARTALGDRFVGDEWIHLDAEGTARALGYRMRVWAWQLADAPHLARHISRSQRLKLGLIGAALRVAPPALRPALARRHGVYLAPRAAFAEQLVDSVTVTDLVLLESHVSDEVTVREADPGQLAERACASNRFERRGLDATYAALQFAIPGTRDQRIDRAAAIESERAHQLFAGLSSRVVAHPYPVRLHRLGPLI